MKTTKNYLVLGIALIVSTINVFATNPQNKNTQVSASPVIRYQVKIDLPAEMASCNLYQVEILDGKGYQVVPAKIFTSGVSLYEFYERGSVRGARIARFSKVPIDNTGEPDSGVPVRCGVEYFARPAALMGTFENGQTYKFELFPQVWSPK